jgi:hypothetical protein
MTDDKLDAETVEEAENIIRRKRKSQATGFDSVRKNVSETEDKITLKWTCKRGNGTRDEDRFDVKVKGDAVEDVVGDIIHLMDGIATDQGGLMDAARDIQPEDGDV